MPDGGRYRWILFFAGIMFIWQAGILLVPDIQAFQTQRTGSVTGIDITTLRQLIRMDPNLYLVDVREPEEFNGPAGHIESAVNLPLKIISELFSILPGEKTLVFICESGPRSRKAANIFADHGYTVYYVKGGMQAWNKFKKPSPDDSDTIENEKEEETPEKIEIDFGC